MNKKSTFHKILNAIKEFDEEIAHLHFSTVFDRALDFIQTRLSIKHTSIALLNDELKGFFIFVAGKRVQGIDSGDFLPLTNTILSEVIQGTHPLYRPDIKKDHLEYDVDKILLKAGFRSDFLLPLIVNDKCIGTLNTAAMRVDGIGENKRILLQLLAPRLALAIQYSLIVAEVKNREEKYRGLVETIEEKHFIYIHNTEGIFTYLSPSITRILGYSPEEFCTHYTQYLTDNPVNRDVERRTDLSIKGVRQPPYEVEICHKNGNIRWLEVSEVPVFDSKKKVLAVQGIAHEITEKKLAEESLRESEKRYRRLIDSVTDYIYTVYTENGRPVETKHGPGCVAVTGYSSEEYDADPYLWYRMVHEEDRVRVEEHAATLFSGQGHQPVEHRIIHKSGKVVWVRNTPVPRYDQQGNLIAYDGLIVDITEHKLAEEERLKLQEQLVHAQKMEAVGLLAGGVAHDFNNILTAIIGYANIVKMKLNDDDPLKINLDQIITSSLRGAHLTQSLLAFSRKQLINPKPVDLNTIIRNIQDLLSRVISEDIDMQIILDKRPFRILADSGQIEQVLINLVTNARDAMPQGGTLIIRTGMTTIEEQFKKDQGFGIPGMYVLLSINDTGTGMDEKTKDKIFEPFFTTKEVGRGTGLGLAMVYGAIKQNKGYITVFSEPGTGTTFNIYLPLLAASAEVEKGTLPVVFDKGGTETVLIAEDDESLRDLVSLILKEFGYKIIEAKDGVDAVDKFTKHQEEVKLVILDVIMPRKNGRKAYEDIIKINPQMKVLFISGYTAEIVHTKGILDLGLNFLSKPIMPDQLLRKVREILVK